MLPARGAAAVSADEKIGSNEVSGHPIKTVVNTVEASPISVGPRTSSSECPTDQTDAIPVEPQEAPEQEHQVKYPPTPPAIRPPEGTVTSQDEATTTGGDEQTGLGKSSTGFPNPIKVEAENPTTQLVEQQPATPSAADNGNCPPTQGHGNDDDTSDSGPAGSNTGNGSGDGEGSGGTGGGQGGGGDQGGSDGISGGTGSSGGTDGQGGSGGSIGGATTAPDTSSVPASEAASPSTDTQPAGSSEALALQQPATDVSPASAAASTMPPLPQVLPRTGQRQALTSLAGIGLVLLGCGVILLRRPARAR